MRRIKMILLFMVVVIVGMILLIPFVIGTAIGWLLFVGYMSTLLPKSVIDCKGRWTYNRDDITFRCNK